MVGQVGGDHYSAESGYEHWDWVPEIGLGYLPATATKYLVRLGRKDDPLVELEKSLSYLRKWDESPQWFGQCALLTEHTILNKCSLFCGDSWVLSVHQWVARVQTREGIRTAIGILEQRIRSENG